MCDYRVGDLCNNCDSPKYGLFVCMCVCGCVFMCVQWQHPAVSDDQQCVGGHRGGGDHGQPGRGIEGVRLHAPAGLPQRHAALLAQNHQRQTGGVTNGHHVSSIDWLTALLEARTVDGLKWIQMGHSQGPSSNHDQNCHAIEGMRVTSSSNPEVIQEHLLSGKKKLLPGPYRA